MILSHVVFPLITCLERLSKQSLSEPVLKCQSAQLWAGFLFISPIGGRAYNIVSDANRPPLTSQTNPLTLLSQYVVEVVP